MRRFIVAGLMLALLSGCATVGVMGKFPEEVTMVDASDMAWEWWDMFLFILGFLPKGW